MPPFVKYLIATLQGAGFLAYAVGGCVRDMLLGVTPKDYDIATNARPEQIMGLFQWAHLVGESFGVVLVPNSANDGTGPVEIATFRSEGRYSDGRRPDSVVFVDTPEEDSKRRDFTINAMYHDPSGWNLADGLLDFHGGRKDLSDRMLRTVGNANDRFAEDYLRMLRAVRFSAKYGLGVATNCMYGMLGNAEKIQLIASERVRDELDRILTQGNLRRGLDILRGSRLLEFIIPELKPAYTCEQDPEYHPEGTVWEHIMEISKHMPPNPSLTLVLAALLHDVGKPKTQTFADRIRFIGHETIGAEMAEDILGRLKYSNEVINRVTWLIQNHMRIQRADEMKVSKLRRMAAEPGFDELLDLAELDSLGSRQGPTGLKESLSEKLGSQPTVAALPVPLVNGDDLIGLGLTPGPEFKLLLDYLMDQQLEGCVTTKVEALEKLRQVRMPQ